MSNMNIGAWPMEKEELTNSHVKCREILSNDRNRLFWTKLFLQTSPYDEGRYRRIAFNACERIVQEEIQGLSSRGTSHRSPSIIAVSFSETSTRKSYSNNRSSSKQIGSPINSRVKSSSRRFSCYLKSHNTHNQPQKIKRNLSTVLQKNNNNHQEKTKYLSLKKKIVLTKNNEYQEKLCKKCLKLNQDNLKLTLSKAFCRSCSPLMRQTNDSIKSKKTLALNKNEENELRQIIEIVIEEFQDHFGQALNLSIKQMTQHLLSNINLFYNHYQKEFEQLTKKYRLEFLERFIKLMKKCQNSQIKTNHYNQQTKTLKFDRNSITRPPDILSMSSLSGSLVTIRDRSETLGNLMTPSNSMSLSTTSKRSIAIDGNGKCKERRNRSTQNSSSKRTFIVNRTADRQSLSKSSKQATSSTLQLIDAYRFRDTLRMKNSHFSSPCTKLQ